MTFAARARELTDAKFFLPSPGGGLGFAMATARCVAGVPGLSTRRTRTETLAALHPARAAASCASPRARPLGPLQGLGAVACDLLQILPGFTRPYPFCLNFAHRIGGWASRCLFFRTKTGCDVRFLKRSGSSFKLPTLRFRAKIMLGFAVVLAISAASMGFAYLGFERVSAGVDSYRRSVQEADLSRDIDRELISYRSLARYFVVDRKGRGRQGGAGRRNQPEGRDHCLDEGNHQPDAARAGRETGAGIPHLHQDFRRHPQGQGRERAHRAKPAHAHRQLAALQARRSPEQCRRRRNAGDHARREEGDRAVSGGDGGSPIRSWSIRTRRSQPARWRA